MKLDGTSKRKLSKRHDPEAALSFYQQKGYPAESVREYVMTLLNSNFEEWRSQNPTADLDEFSFTTEKMSASGALFDLKKLDDVSKNTIARFDAQKVLEQVLAWSKEYDPALFAQLDRDHAFSRAIFAIGRQGEKPRKDLASWDGVRDYAGFFFEENYRITEALPAHIPAQDVATVIDGFLATYDPADDQTAWFEKITAIAVENGYAAKPKEYKKQPELYKGHVGDVSMILRLALTGKCNSPDMYAVMQVLGKDTVTKRLLAARELLA